MAMYSCVPEKLEDSDDLVEGPLHVQHHGVQAASRFSVVPVLIVSPADAVHQPGGVVQRGQAHRLGKPAGRVDGQHHDVPPARCGPQADRRGDRRLADPARAAADDDPGAPVADQAVDVERRRLAAGHQAAFCSRSADASRYRPARSIPPLIQGS